MKKKSIISKYFWLCSVIILVSIICIGTILFLATSQYYKGEKKNAFLQSADRVISKTQSSFAYNDNLEVEKLRAEYKKISDELRTNFTLIDLEGNCIICSDTLPCFHSKRQFPVNALIDDNDDGVTFDLGDFGGYYLEDMYNLSQKISLGKDEYYFITSQSAESLKDALSQFSRAFIIAMIIISLVVFTLVYLTIRRILSPIKQMTEAAQRFGTGDFSQKIDVNEDNEIGILATSLNEMAISLENLDNSRKSFVANVSHELKTPMTTIGGFIDGIIDGTIPKEQERHYLKIVSEEVSRLARLVVSMLNISKYEAGEMKLKITNFNLNELTFKTVLLFEKKIDAKKIEIVGLDALPHFVKADIDLIQQVIYNLVENAVKFVNESGTISFDFQSEDEEKITIAIRNSGEGLSREELPRVFDRFYKTDESHGKDKTGVGLGLAIVRSVMKLHGSQIMVKSIKGEYTEFSFQLDEIIENHERE
ncbi:MAG: HAMP domain-containing sensor histidine kinase [Oscillospiraceae bacterium]